jgi:methyl coenzyme M reductase subunit C
VHENSITFVLDPASVEKIKRYAENSRHLVDIKIVVVTKSAT